MTAAIIITHNRPELLRECVEAIAPQVDTVVILDNASEPPVRAQDLPLSGVAGCVQRVLDQPPNIARLWNTGLSMLPDTQHVAFLCDDAIVPAGWFDAVTNAMIETGAVAGCSDSFNSEHPPAVKTTHDRDLFGRMCGWAFVIDLRSTVRPDESFHWWWCDTDIDWQARLAGGTVTCGGYTVENRLPNDFTNSRPELAERTGADAAAFAAKWGSAPW